MLNKPAIAAEQSQNDQPDMRARVLQSGYELWLFLDRESLLRSEDRDGGNIHAQSSK
jgi:hypothetical protein